MTNASPKPLRIRTICPLPMDYLEFTSWMFGLERFGIKLGLENITEFLHRIGDPHQQLKSVHVTGTNGKGSVCAFTDRILREHGLRVGLYTSPHLVDFRERIKVNGRMIPEKDVIRIGLELKRVMEEMSSNDAEKQLTFFEFTTGLAFRYFAERKVDVLVAEVGMGGRLDATNVLSPYVAVITRIGLEHTNYLGTTIPDIAREKAGIVKSGSRVVTCERGAEALSVIANACEKKRTSLRRIGKDFEVSKIAQTLRGTTFDYSGDRNLRGIETRLIGGYQAENAATAIATIEDLSKSGIFVTDDEIRTGLLKTRWEGRLDVVSRKPLVILDGSHNPDGISTTVRTLRELDMTPLTYVLGCMDDKDVNRIVEVLSPTASAIIATQAKYKRALPSKSLEAVVKDHFSGQLTEISDSTEAFEHGIKRISGKGLCVIGSLYLVGEAIQWWKSRSTREPSPTHKI